MSDTSATQYRLRVRVGPGMDDKDLRAIAINDDANPTLIETDKIIARVVVRIKGFDKTLAFEQGQKDDGLTPVPDSKWFQLPGADSNLSSIQIQMRFKREWPCERIVYGNQFDKPLRLPPLSSVILKFVQYIDPGLKADIYSDKPYAFSSLIGTMNTVNVSAWDGHKEADAGLPPWPSPNGEHIPEDTSLMFKKQEEVALGSNEDAGSGKEVLGMKEPAETSLSTSKRRSYFGKESNLAEHRIRPDQVYGFDFFNPYLSFTDFTLKIPGFSIDITKYWDGQPFTYIIKTEDSSVVFMAVQFELVPITDITIE
ncbi:hypothetical protein BGW38_008043 [Lunasporangiospora selenospora]|uniref:Domain of unknown function at the cortex 1 domain-containing protein n=1 Tax=Lunasporangiospora selenospora TaxID=979761 RepID=A0A9P6FYT9_9FUNG|nr:hypothetical protein BGW38_008043 [Lunasporangiospora selenospora]